MSSVVDKKRDEGQKLKTHNVDSVKYVERKLVDRGIGRLERHPADGLPLKHDPKKGHGKKYTWEGPLKEFEALDDKDPNYPEVDDGEGTDSDLVVGEVEVAKTADKGVARIELDPNLKM